MIHITDQLIKRATGEYDCEIITRLRLEQLGITIIQNLDRCESLIELSLSRNEITSTAGLSTLTSLRVLDLSFNRIPRIELESLVSLITCDLRANLISEVQDLSTLAKISTLKTLSLRDRDHSNANPVCAHPAYRNNLLMILPGLDTLDGTRISLSSAAEAVELCLQAIVPDKEKCVSPRQERWLPPLDTDEAETSRMSTVNQTIEKTKDMLAIECTDLLRQAQSCLTSSMQT